MEVLAAKGPVLVHFFDFSQLNSVRSLPYVNEWHRRYRDLGLTVVGVQAPRFPFGSDPEIVRAGLGRVGVEFPVVIDNDQLLWSSYGCEGWPSLFLWGRGGILQWFHFGEGDYQSTEEAIQTSLGKAGADADLPGPMEPIRDTDRQGIEVIPPGAELILAEGRPWTVADDGDGFDIEYEGAGLHATAGGRGTIHLMIDGVEISPVEIDGPGLYDLADHDRHGSHRVAIRLEGSPEIWSVSFSPALA